MSKISREHILKLASLSKLQLTEEDIKRYQRELSAILDYVERLESVDTDGFEPTYQVSGLRNQFRRDAINIDTVSYTAEDLMAIVPHTKDGYIQVGRMI